MKFIQLDREFHITAADYVLNLEVLEGNIEAQLLDHSGIFSSSQ